MSSKISVKEFIKEYENVDLFIPLLQRNYKWPDNAKKDNNNSYNENESGKRNTAHNLIWEIIDNYEKNKKNETTMTLGIVVLYKEEDTTKQLILDGQQRLITLTLIARCLLKKMNREGYGEEWFTYKFERDFDLKCNCSRYGYMFELEEQEEQEENKSVDLDRMRRNYKEIERVIDGKEFTDYEGLLSYIKTNIFFIVRITTTPPLDEFFNINSHKTPFSISDYIKVFLLNDISTIENNEEKLEKKNKILSLYRDISYYLYYKEEDSDNSIYEMVSREYDNIRKSLSVNRMDLIFEDKYNPDRKKTAEVNREDISSIYNLDSEMERIEYFFYVLKGIKEELYTRDSENNVHKNSNVFNSFYVLNTYVKKRFFSLFSEDDIKSKKDPNGVISSFCLQEFCAKETRKLENINASNAFIDSVMHYEINDNIKKESNITVNNEEEFEKVEKLFFGLYDEYTEIIKKGKELNNKQIKEEEIKYTEQNGNKAASENQEQNQYTIKDLFEKVNKIIIPEIQRDYIKGCDIKNFLNDILNKITKCLLEKIEFNKNIWEKIVGLFRQIDFKKDLKNKMNNSANEILEKVLLKRLVIGKSENCFGFLYGEIEPDDLDWRFKNNKEKIEKIEYELENVDFIKNQLNNNSIKNNLKYTASCIVGYCDNENNLFIYDGQQRLVTFVCAIGWLKRKVKDVPKEVNDLYKKFEFSGRNKANEAIKTLYESDDDKDDELLKKLRSLICDQTTDAIYKLVCKLKKKCDSGVFIPYNYFYDMMSIEYYGIEKSDETTQLFMDINDGCRLEEYEIYKAEFMHYLKEKGSCESVKEIQKKLDNSFINLFFGLNNPEEEEIKALKELIKITYIERFHDYKYSEFPEALIDIVDKFADNKFIEKLDLYMSKFEDYIDGVKENSNESYYYDYNNISTFCSSEQYEECNELKYNNIFNNYHFEDSDDGSVLLYCDFEKFEELVKKNLELNELYLDLKLKIRYDLHEKGYIKLEDFKCKYNLDYDEEKFNNLLKQMTNKDFRDDDEDDDEGNKVEYKPIKVSDSEIQLTSDDCKDNLLLEVLSNNDNSLMNNLENLFFGENVTLNLSREKIIEILNEKNLEEDQLKIIYETFANNYEVVVLGDKVYIYDYEKEKYKKTENDINFVLGIKLTLNYIKKYCKKEFKISEFGTLDKKKALCILLLLKYDAIDLKSFNFKYYKKSGWYLSEKINNNVSFLFKNNQYVTYIENAYYYYCYYYANNDDLREIKRKR